MSEKIKGVWKRLAAYRYLLLVLAVGIGLLMLPTGKSGTPAAEEVKEESEKEWLSAVEKEMEQTLSHIDGAGEVHLMLTVDRGMENRFAEDAELESSDDSERRRYETVLVSDGSRGESTVKETQTYPAFRGALVVCEGGELAEVRLAVLNAVKVLTGLSSDKISIVKGS